MVFANPYLIAGSAFLLSILTYFLYWSGIYPDLEFPVLAFFSFFIAGTFFLGFLLKDYFLNSFVKAKRSLLISTCKPRDSYYFVILVIYLIEVTYNGGVPILRMISGENIDYRDFSFPVIHVFFVTFTSFCSLLAFLYFLKTKKVKYGIYSFGCLLVFVSLMHRSGVLFIVLNMASIYFLYGGLNVKKMVKSFLFLFAILFLFGLAGDLRTRSQIGSDSDFNSTVLMEATDASPFLLEQKIIHPLYWSYLYLSSPLANFQSTIKEFSNKDIPSSENFIQFLLYEIFPDLLTNKITSSFDYPESYSGLVRVIDFLTVGTIFGDSFALVGWLGPILLSLLFLFTPVFICVLTPKNNLYIIQVSVCGIILSLCTFSNMLVYSTFTLHFVYPFLLSYDFRKLFRIYKG